MDPTQHRTAPHTPAADLEEPQCQLSIGELADRSGLGTDTLRVWEQRYGKPCPIRLPSGHRRYSEADVRWARRCAEALACGHRASEIVPLADDELEELLRASALRGCGDPRIEQWLQLAQERRFAELAAALEASELRRCPATWFDQTLAPWMHAVGRCWADGSLAIRHEKQVSHLVAELLRRRLARHPPCNGRPSVLLATPQQELHGLGILMAAILCARRGLHHVLLGTSVPLIEIAAAAIEEGCEIVALGISIACGRRDCEQHLRELRRRLPARTKLVLGGAGGAQIRRPYDGILPMRSFVQFDEWLAQQT